MDTPPDILNTFTNLSVTEERVRAVNVSPNASTFFYWRPVIHDSRLAVSNAGASLTLIRFSTRTYLVCYWPILLRSFQLSQLLFALLHLDCCIALIKQYLMLICREWFPTLLSPSESNNIALLLSWLSICLYPCSASECLVQSIGPICLRLILIGNTFQILK